jgi:hypothetical protein
MATKMQSSLDKGLLKKSRDRKKDLPKFFLTIN